MINQLAYQTLKGDGTVIIQHRGIKMSVLNDRDDRVFTHVQQNIASRKNGVNQRSEVRH